MSREKILLLKMAEECNELAFECIKRVVEDRNNESEIEAEIKDLRKYMKAWKALKKKK